MTVVVTDNCTNCRFTECVSVCPVSCFHADDNMLYIDSNVCVDCCACIPVCPVQAIFTEEELPEDKLHWVATNRERSAVLPVLDMTVPPLAGAEERRTALGF